MYFFDFFLFIFFTLFCLGFFGIFQSKNNLIKLFISLEIQFLAISGFLLTTCAISSNGIGLIISFFILMIAGAETAVGLIIFFLFSEENFSVKIDSIAFLKH